MATVYKIWAKIEKITDFETENEQYEDVPDSTFELAMSPDLSELQTIMQILIDESQSQSTSPDEEPTCPGCGGEMELDWEHMQKHYGEANSTDLKPELLVYFCEVCDRAFDGNGKEL